jgi:competence protein ComEA
MNRAQTTAGLVLVLVAVAAGMWWGDGEAESIPTLAAPDPPTSGSSGDDSMITVHVAGLVSRPGLVELPEGSRVADAVAAAGGLLPGARAEAINLAAALSDGQQIVVPEADGDRPATSAGTPDGKVHLNQATASELDSLPGVGPVIAERIVSYREENGPFETIEDLLDVPGIGEAKLADLRDHVQVP